MPRFSRLQSLFGVRDARRPAESGLGRGQGSGTSGVFPPSISPSGQDRPLGAHPPRFRLDAGSLNTDLVARPADLPASTARAPAPDLHPRSSVALLPSSESRGDVGHCHRGLRCRWIRAERPIVRCRRRPGPSTAWQFIQNPPAEATGSDSTELVGGTDWRDADRTHNAALDYARPSTRMRDGELAATGLAGNWGEKKAPAGDAKWPREQGGRPCSAEYQYLHVPGEGTASYVRA